MNTATQRKVENPLLSVIVPVYNAARFIPRCLESLLGQTYRNLEIICVNDGSADDSAAVLDAYAAKDSRVKVIHKENAGVSEARNRGLALAKGDIIGFCDADDAYVPGALERVVALFESAECEIVVTGFYTLGEEGAGPVRCVPEAFPCTGRELQERMLYQDCIMGAVWNKFFKRACVSGVKFDTRLTHCEDMHFVSQVLQRIPGARVFISPEVTYEYRVSEVSATRDVDRLLDARGNLRYVEALEAILALYPGDRKLWLLIRSCQFRLIEENIDQFRVAPQVVRSLAWGALRYAAAFILCRRRYSLRSRIKRFRHVAGYLWLSDRG